MTLTTQGSNITIEGNIKSIDDFQRIKSALDTMTDSHKRIDILIRDSFSMTSSVIGYLNKIIQKDGIILSMQVGDDRLYNILKDLALMSIFNVKKL